MNYEIVARRFSINIFFKQHFVLVLNILILLISLFVSYYYYHGTLSAGDAVYTFSMHGGDYGDSPLQLINHWYLFINGRVTQAVIAAVFMIFSYFSPIPESYPWWIISWLEIFCLVVTPVNLVIFLCKNNDIPRSLGFLFLIFIWSIWSTNDIIFAPSHMHQSIEGYYLPVYLLSLSLLWLSKQNLDLNTKKAVLFYSFIYLFLSLVGEQFIPSIPLLFLTVLFVNRDIVNKKNLYIKYLLISILLSLAAAIVFFAAPGQYIRSSNVNASFTWSNFSVENLLQWFITVTSLGYDSLFHWKSNLPSDQYVNSFLFDWLPNFKIWLFFICIAVFPLIVTITTWIFNTRQKRAGKINKKVSDNKLFRTSFFILIIHVTYLVIMSTLLISNYFPLYAIIYPSLLLAIGICMDFYLISLLFIPEAWNPLSLIIFNSKKFTGEMNDKNSWGWREISIILSVICGLILSFGFTPRLLSFITFYYKVQTLIVIGIGLTPVFGYIAYQIIIKWTLPRLEYLINLYKVTVIICSFLIGIYIWNTMIRSVPLPSVWYELLIEAVGRSNSASLGSEVWLGQIEYGDGYVIPYKDLIKTGDWEEKGGYLVSDGLQKAALQGRFRTRADQKIKITFAEHDHAGIVDIKINKDVTQIDLFDHGLGGDHIEILSVPADIWSKLLSFCEMFSVCILIFLMLAWLFLCPQMTRDYLQKYIAYACTIVIIMFSMLIPNFQDVRTSYQTFLYTQIVRKLTYQKIEAIYRGNKNSNIYLIHCPRKSYYNHYGFDSPWGIESNLLWRGIYDIEVAVDQDVDLISLDNSIDYIVVECEYPDEVH